MIEEPQRKMMSSRLQFKVTIVKYGQRSTFESDVYLNHRLYGQPDLEVEMAYYVWVVQNSDVTVVVDTGFSRAIGEKRERTTVLDLLAAFEHLGASPSSAPTVVVTHAHYDHIGNIGMFANSPILIAKAEYDFWTGSVARRAQFAHWVESSEVDQLKIAAAEGRLRQFRGEFDLVPGIRLLEVGGHTAGQTLLLVDTAEGTVLLASDAVHYYKELEHDMPFAIVADLAAMYCGFDRVKAMLADGTATHLVPGHDPTVLERFTPVKAGPLAGLAATIG